MFRGSIPKELQLIVRDVVSRWDCSDVYVGCSGNFTVERVIHELGRYGLHGNDVTLYSSVIGSYLASNPFRMVIKPDAQDNYGWLEKYLNPTESGVATVMLAAELLAGGISVTGAEKDNRYYRRMKEATQIYWDGLHAKTRDTVQNTPMRLKSYYAGDVFDWIQTLDQDQAVVCYPPFAGVGASTQYEESSRKLESVFDWDKPSYKFLEGERLAEFFRMLTHRRYWMFGSNRPLPAYEPYLNSVIKRTNRSTTVYIYYSAGETRIVAPHQQTDPVLATRLATGQDIGDRMAINPIGRDQFQALRSQYMNEGIRPGRATSSYAVTVDGYLIGCFALSDAPRKRQVLGDAVSKIYLMSDFPVRPTSYKNLAKLILYAALSKESKLLQERTTKRRIRFMETTAYSNNPISMKYRGLFDLFERKENPTTKTEWGSEINLTTNEYYRRTYELEYKGDMGRWTLQEGLDLWKKKYSQKDEHADQDHQD